MEPKQYKVDNFLDIRKILRSFRPHGGVGWCYRGQSDASWPLLPKAGRPEFFNGNDIGRFNEWKMFAVAYNKNLPENDLECLSIAQHYGLATRLLDWSYNPLVGVYYAVNEKEDSDGICYCYFPEHYIDAVEAKDLIHWEYVPAIIPRAIVPRILNQRGLFTYHSEPNKPLKCNSLPPPLEGPNLIKIIIDKNAKIDILDELNDYGLNKVTLFPDLDGLSSHVNWETQRIVKKKTERIRIEQMPNTSALWN